MLGGRMGALEALAALLALASAVPLHRLPRESEDYQSMDPYDNYTANEMCFSDNRVFQKGALMPNPGPCEECRCEPPSIVCNMIKCPVNNNGCRTIQRANHCCPDYNCECDYNGQIYNDGERLDLPEEPCQVCYCKGGDVMCTSITCYERHDCTPIHVPGQCCPKYENCPIRDGTSNGEDKDNRTKSANRTINNSPKREMQPWLLTKSAPQTVSVPILKQTDGPTTENGNIVIVSDWLTERKTTTEDAAGQDASKQESTTLDHTDGPLVVTDLGPAMTVLHQKKENHHSSVGGPVVKSETITPVDEVIFTRIDMLKGTKDKGTESPMSTSSKGIDEGKLSRNREGEELISIVKTTEVEFLTTTPGYQIHDEDMSLQMKKVELESSEKESNPISTEIQSTTDSTTENVQHDSEEIVSTNNHLNVKGEFKLEDTTESTSDTTVTPNVLAENLKTITTNDTLTVTNNHANATHNGKDAGRNEQKSHEISEEITLENASGLNTSSVEEGQYSSTIEPRDYYDNGKPEKIIKEQLEFGQSTLDKEVVLTSDTTEGYLIENVLEEESKTALIGEEFKKDSSDMTNGLASQEQVVILDNALTTTVEEIETTTPYFTEDHMSGLNMEADSVLQEFKNVEEETTVNDEETTTELEETTAQALVDTETSNDRSPSGERELQRIDMVNANILLKDSPTLDYDVSTESPTTDRMSETDIQETELFTADFSEDETKYDIHEVTPITEGDKNTVSPLKPTISGVEEGSLSPSPHIETMNGTSVTVGSHSAIQNKAPVNTLEEQEVTLNVHYEDFTNESEEGISSAPPVIDLNSHVPFLQIGGPFGSDMSSEENDEPSSTALPLEEEKNKNGIKMERIKINEESRTSSDSTNVKEEKTEPFEVLFMTLPPSNDETNTDLGVDQKKAVESRTEAEQFTTVMPTLISLTPGDLKALAEYLIHEKIKPVTKVDSPNQWLTGNLTSEEKMASILTAANISIGIMNQTESGLKVTSLETSTRSNEIIKLDKFDKEGLFKGNSIVDHTNQALNKSGSLHNKYNKNHDVSKNLFKSQTALNDGASVFRELSTDSLNEISPSTVSTNLDVKKEIVTEDVFHQNSENLNSTENLKEVNKKNESDDFLSKNYKENKYLFNINSSSSPGETVTPKDFIVEANPTDSYNSNFQNLERYRNEDTNSEVKNYELTEDSSRRPGSQGLETQKSSSPSINNDLTTPKEVLPKETVVP